MNWQAYPDNLGHKEFPGCFRCHDGKHVTEEGKPLNSSCGICHEFLQASATGLQRVAATPAFAHPWKLGRQAREDPVRHVPHGRSREAGHLQRLSQDRRVGSADGEPDVQPVPQEGAAGAAAGGLHDLPRGARRPAQGGDPFRRRLHDVSRAARLGAGAARDLSHVPRRQGPAQSRPGLRPVPRLPRQGSRGRPARDHLRWSSGIAGSRHVHARIPPRAAEPSAPTAIRACSRCRRGASALTMDAMAARQGLRRLPQRQEGLRGHGRGQVRHLSQVLIGGPPGWP